MYLYFDHDNKNDNFFGPKYRQDEEKAKENIFRYAKSLLTGYGFNFQIVLTNADDQIRYDYMVWKKNGHMSIVLSFDSDFPMFGLKTIRVNP